MQLPSIPCAAALLLALSAHAQDARRPAPDLVETAQAAGSFETLLAAAQAAGLVEALRGDGPLTVFAPTDAAFAKLGSETLAELLRPESRDRLTAILKHHVVAGRVDALAALRAGQATTLAGDAVGIRLEEGRLKVGEALVVQNDVAARNGVIHVIDTVLLPPAGSTVPTEPRAAARQLLELAVERGAPRFNDGDSKTCVELYDLALVAVLGLGGDLLGQDARREIERARADARREAEPRQQAWRLRRGIDAAWRELDAPQATPATSGRTAEPAGRRNPGRLRPADRG